MPRIRSIKPQFWSDEKLARLDPLTRLVFIGLWSLADDAGRLIDNVKQLDGELFPFTDDSSREALDTLARLSRITRYTGANGSRVIQITHWGRHQRIVHPSQTVLPPPDSNGSRETREDDASPSAESRESLGPDLGSRRKEEGRRSVEVGARPHTHEALASTARNPREPPTSRPEPITDNGYRHNLGLRLGNHQALAHFLDHLPRGQSALWWMAHISSRLDQGADPRHVAQALADFHNSPYPLSPANFDSFVDRAIRDATTPTKGRSSSSSSTRVGADGLTASQREAKHAQGLVDGRRGRADGEEWWRLVELAAKAAGKVKLADVYAFAASQLDLPVPAEPPRARP